jgi:hypothetical protein
MSLAIGRRAAAGLLAAAAAAGAPAGFTVESNGTTATVTARPPTDPAGADLTVSVSSAARSASWEYRNLFLDQESGAPPAEILQTNQRDYLFVLAYTGGASCCWTLMVYDLAELQPVRGQQLASRSPIELVHDKDGCKVGAVATPFDPREGAGPSRTNAALYCFDGGKFSRKDTTVTAPVPTAPLPEPSGAKAPPAGGIPEFFKGQWEPLTARCQPDGILSIDDRRMSFATGGAQSFMPQVVSANGDSVDLTNPSGDNGRGSWRLERVELPHLEGIDTIRVRHSETGFESEPGSACIYTRHEAGRR